MNITGGTNLSLYEVNEAADIVSSASDPEVNMIFGSVINEELKDEILVTVIATGFDERENHSAMQQPRPKFQQQPPASHSSNHTPASSREETAHESRPAPSYSGADSDTLDIPTFLRNRNRNRRK